ncbi:hypothetical protein BHM03_00054484, partial [Ensete ventricosum]
SFTCLVVLELLYLSYHALAASQQSQGMDVVCPLYFHVLHPLLVILSRCCLASRQYGLDTSMLIYNSSGPGRYQQAMVAPAEETGRCTIL